VFFGNGSGDFNFGISKKFTVAHVTDNAYRFYSFWDSPLAAGDFNNDGSADIVVHNPRLWSLRTYLGDGRGNFKAQPESTVIAGGEHLAMQTADFDSDGFLDLALLSDTGTWIHAMRGDGTGGFRGSWLYEFHLRWNETGFIQKYSMAVSDFNWDGKPDIAVVGRLGVVEIFINNGGGFERTAISEWPLGDYRPRSSSITAADFNGDGNMDLVYDTTCSPAFCEYDPTISDYRGEALVFLLGNGKGGFTLSPIRAEPPSRRRVVAGDFNHDGRTDLIYGGVLLQTAAP
jgi:hypothetical protein